MDQEAAVCWQGFQGLLAQKFSVGALAGCPFRNQSITTLNKSGSTWGGKALFQGFELVDHGIKQPVAVVQQQFQLFSFRTKIVQLLPQAVLFQAC